METLIAKTNSGESLSFEEAVPLFEAMLEGSITDSQIASALISMKLRRERPGELAALVAVMNARKKTFDAGTECVDTCGTGGDGKQCVNVSTACAIILAAMGFNVAKHGNYAQSGNVGSADILTALGVDIHSDPARSMKKTGMSFLLAPDYHPSLKSIGRIRRELRVPTVFNMAGPLANPANPAMQIIGLSSRERMELCAGALAMLGRTNVTVYTSADGYDEVSSAARTECILIASSGEKRITIDPADFFEPFPMPRAGNLDEALRQFMAGLDGRDANIANLFALNVALALFAFRECTLGEGYLEAKECIMKGRARVVLHALVECSERSDEDALTGISGSV